MSKRGGHHGGSWKVAYADFVTAMMALFLVLWLTSQDEKIKKAVERAFTQPFVSINKEVPHAIGPDDDMVAVRTSDGPETGASAIELDYLRRLNEDLIKSLEDQELDDEQPPVKLELIPDGLRISIFDRARKPIFASGSRDFTPYGKWVVQTVAWGVAQYTNFVVEVEGHTERGAKLPDDGYGEWELTADRANAARRLLVEQGVGAGQIQKIAGFGATLPYGDNQPDDRSNSRVEVFLRVGRDE